MQEDSYFVSQVLAGNLDAFDHLVCKYKDKIYRLMLRMIGQPEDAKDLTQECFILMYLHLHNYDPSRRFATWFYKIALNRCWDELRKKKAKPVAIMDTSSAAAQETPEQLYIEKESYQSMLTQIDQLPDHYRAVFLLRYIDHLSYGEISELLEISTTDVRNYLYRAKQKLKAQHNRNENNKEVCL